MAHHPPPAARPAAPAATPASADGRSPATTLDCNGEHTPTAGACRRARADEPRFAHACIAVLCLCFGVGVGACGGPESESGPPVEPPAEGEFDLISPQGWVALSAEEDPWRDVRPEPLDCPRYTPHEEEGLLEFDTKICPHFAVERPLLADVHEGDRIRLVGSHSVLVATGNATGHLEVRIGDDVLFDYSTPIPGPANILILDTVAPASAQAGSMIRVHVRNHGANAWKINTLRVTR